MRGLAVGERKGRILLVKNAPPYTNTKTLNSGANLAAFWFADDGQRIRTVSRKGVVRSWSIASGEEIARWDLGVNGITSVQRLMGGTDLAILARQSV